MTRLKKFVLPFQSLLIQEQSGDFLLLIEHLVGVVASVPSRLIMFF